MGTSFSSRRPSNGETLRIAAIYRRVQRRDVKLMDPRPASRRQEHRPRVDGSDDLPMRPQPGLSETAAIWP
jgi:hypothetical protein